MIKFFQSINLKSEFTKSVLVLMTGSTIAQAIPIAISPILTRIYTPEDFGILAMFVTVTAIFSTVATARYELAIILPENDSEGSNLTILSVFISLIICIFLLLFFYLFNSRISHFLGDEKIGPWLYFAPFVIFLSSLFNALKYYNIRKNNYSLIAQAGTMQSIFSASIQLVLGLFKFGNTGLLLGNGMPFVVSNFIFLRKSSSDFLNSFRQVTFKKLNLLANQYNEFPKYSLTASMANILSQNLSNIFISSFFSVYALGQYALVLRILSMPSILLGTAIGDVFTKKAIDEKIKTGCCTNSFRNTYIILGVFSFIIFTPLYFVITPLFTFVFGQEWIIAGKFAQILIPLLAIKFWMSPLTMVFVIFSKQQKVALKWQVFFLLATIGIFLVVYFLKSDIEFFLWLYSIVTSLIYLLQFFVLKEMVGKNDIYQK
ncbi:MAG: oligosaccharide flippase family protein [Bacteroidota bacterium]